MVNVLRIRGDVGMCPELADGVKFVESVDAGGAGQSVPVVTAALAPAIDPGLTGGGVGERTHIAGFTMNAVLIAAQESSFQRITLKSSHRVLPSLLTVMSRWPCGKAGQTFYLPTKVHCRRGELSAPSPLQRKL